MQCKFWRYAHNVSQRRHQLEVRATTIYRLHAHKLVSLGHVVLEICSRTERQTDRQTRSSQYSAPYGDRVGLMSGERQ